MFHPADFAETGIHRISPQNHVNNFYMATQRRSRGDPGHYPNDHAIMVSDHILSFIRDNNTNEFFISSITIFGTEKLRCQIIRSI